jgi:hypothetical protein
MLHALGVSMGDRMKPANRANPKGFFEANQLASICRSSFAEPWMVERNNQEVRVKKLRAWAMSRAFSEGQPASIIGAKHPTLCLMIPDMIEAWPRGKFVVVQRPLEESVKSLEASRWGWPVEAREQTTAKLIRQRDSDLRGSVLRLNYHDVVAKPEFVVRQLLQFTGVNPSPEQIGAAIQHVDPKLHRVRAHETQT